MTSSAFLVDDFFDRFVDAVCRDDNSGSTSLLAEHS